MEIPSPFRPSATLNYTNLSLGYACYSSVPFLVARLLEERTLAVVHLYRQCKALRSTAHVGIPRFSNRLNKTPMRSNLQNKKLWLQTNESYQVAGCFHAIQAIQTCRIESPILMIPTMIDISKAKMAMAKALASELCH